MTAVEMIAFGGLAVAAATALGRIWSVLNARIQEIEDMQAKHQIDVIRGFASIAHFEKLEMKIDRLLEKIETLGLALASNSRAVRSRATEPR